MLQAPGGAWHALCPRRMCLSARGPLPTHGSASDLLPPTASLYEMTASKGSVIHPEKDRR